MSAKITGINMDDILHSMWSGNQCFREGVKIHDSINLKALSTAQNEHKTPRVNMDLNAKLKIF